MSSDIFSRPIDVGRLGLLYAGAQKNAGPAGVTVVVVDREWAASAPASIPAIWSYQTHVEKGSLYHTPPAFGVFCVGLMTQWIEVEGGIEEMERRAAEKAGLVYDAIERSGGFYRAAVTEADHRSHMNVTFRLPDDEREARFLAAAADRDLVGLKGHRSVGGMRASIYNALPVEGVRALASFMDDFHSANG